MRLLGKQLLMLVMDGVEVEEVTQLKEGFEREQAVVLVTTPGEQSMVETVQGDQRGEDLYIDLPFEAVEELFFDGLIIPDGAVSVELLRKDQQVRNLIFTFHQRGLPIFASGSAVELLYDCRVLSQQVVVREGTPISAFLDQAVDVLLDAGIGGAHAYRPTIYA